MRFIHTSDWHLGRSLRNRKDRYDEASLLLDEIALYAETESIDLVILAGDLFDIPTPPAEAEKIAYSFLSRMSRANIPTVIICGNHDSYDRFDSRTELFSLANLTVIGRPRADAIARFTSRKGDKAIVGCLSYLSPRFLMKAGEIFSPDRPLTSGYSEAVGAAVDALSKSFESKTVNILISHAYLQGSVPSHTEREIDTSALYAVPQQRIPATASYVGLGHIHKMQKLKDASVPAYYCGSIMKLDFGEERDEKGFLVVEVSPGLPPSSIEFIKLTGVRNLVTLDVPLKDFEAQADDLRRKIGNGYGKLRIHNREPVPHLSDIVRRGLPEAIAWEIVLPDQEPGKKKRTTPPSLSSLSNPITMFESYYTEECGEPPDPEMLKAMQSLYEEVSDK